MIFDINDLFMYQCHILRRSSLVQDPSQRQVQDLMHSDVGMLKIKSCGYPSQSTYIEYSSRRLGQPTAAMAIEGLQGSSSGSHGPGCYDGYRSSASLFPIPLVTNQISSSHKNAQKGFLIYIQHQRYQSQ